MELLLSGNLVSSSGNREQRLLIIYNMRHYCQVGKVRFAA